MKNWYKYEPKITYVIMTFAQSATEPESPTNYIEETSIKQTIQTLPQSESKHSTLELEQTKNLEGLEPTSEESHSSSLQHQ